MLVKYSLPKLNNERNKSHGDRVKVTEKESATYHANSTNIIHPSINPLHIPNLILQQQSSKHELDHIRSKEPPGTRPPSIVPGQVRRRDVGKLRRPIRELCRRVPFFVGAQVVVAEGVELFGLGEDFRVLGYAVPVDLDDGVFGDVHSVGEGDWGHYFASKCDYNNHQPDSMS